MKPRTIRLPDDLDILLQDEAEKTGTTEAEIIRRVLCDHYRIREGETSIEALIRRVVSEVLADSTSRAPVSISDSTPKAPQSTLEKIDRAPSRTLEAPLEAPSEHPEAPPGSAYEALQKTPPGGVKIPVVVAHRTPDESTSEAPMSTSTEEGGAPPERRVDGLEWGKKRKHRLSNDPIGIEELKKLWRLEPRPTFTEIGQLLGGYSRDVISAKVKELIAKSELEE
jgi:hypothetical protein